MGQDIILLKKYIKLANYLTVLCMYLKNNFFLERPIDLSDIKEKPTGHWGNVSQINFLYPHINYYIKRHSLKDVSLVIGAGHAGIPFLINTFLDGSLERFYGKKMPLQKLIINFSGPLGFRSEINPTYPGTIYAGGELGYSLPTAMGYLFKNPKKTIFCVVGDGEAESGGIAASWDYPYFLKPKTDGVLVPILNLNKFKMGSPSLFANYTQKQLKHFFSSHRLKAYFVSKRHISFIKTLEKIHQDIINWRNGTNQYLPIIIFCSMKGDDAPVFSKDAILNSLKSHKNPLPNIHRDREKIKLLTAWLEKHFLPEFSSFSKISNRNFKEILPKPGYTLGDFQPTKNVQKPLLLKLNKNTSCSIKDMDTMINQYTTQKKLLVFSPDELNSNKLTKTASSSYSFEILNEQICQAWLFGNAIAGKKGLLSSYEGFMPVIDSMLLQVIKFIEERKKIKHLPPIPSLNYILTSVWWENCYSHQNPGFICSAINFGCPFVDIQFPIDTTSAVLGLHKNLDTTNKINIMSLSKREHSCIISPQKAKKLIKNGFLEFYDSQDFNLVFFVMGDALYAEAEKIRKSLKKHKKIHSKILYFYNVFSLINLSEKQLVKITQNKHILFFFPGYINAIKGIMFNKISKEKISFYGYSNKYVSGNTTQKIEANGIAYKNIVKELQHLRLL